MQLAPLLYALQWVPLLLQQPYHLGAQKWVGLLQQFILKLELRPMQIILQLQAEVTKAQDLRNESILAK